MTNPKFQIRNSKSRRGFTLVELLVVVLIIAILATVVLFAMFAAGESARAARTRSMIARVNDLILPIWESYRTRRVPINTSNNPKTAAQQRLDGLHALMRMELPDRKSDIYSVSRGGITSSDASDSIAAPAVTQAYFRMANTFTGNDMSKWSTANQGSECLYLILSRIQDGDTNGLEFVRETEIADTDGDGMPEILDGWGKPIIFLRWAPGFIPANNAVTAIQDGSKIDPFDPMQVRTGTYYLFPLVFSAGPDREFDIAANSSDPSTFEYRNLSPPNDPFTSTLSPQLGTPDTASGMFQDNIHNHLISTGIN